MMLKYSQRTSTETARCPSAVPLKPLPFCLSPGTAARCALAARIVRQMHLLHLWLSFVPED